MDRRYVIGVLGGMGPLATVDLYRKIIEATPARRDQDHLHLIIESNPAVPDRTESLLHGGPDPTPLLLSGAHRLAQAGADFIVVPCNTAHAFLPRIAPQVPIPFVSMVDETARVVSSRLPGARVGILATAGTIAANLYQAAFADHGLSSVVPDDADQARVSRAIAEVKAGQVGTEQTALLRLVADTLIAEGAGALITACTELPLILTQSDVRVPLFDPTQVLAEAAVVRALGHPIGTDALVERVAP